MKGIIRNTTNKMKESILNRLAQGLSPYIQAQLPSVSTPQPKKENYGEATFAATSHLSSEGCVENFAGSANRIIVGENTYVRGRLLTYGHGGEIKIGDWCYIGLNTEIWSMSSVTIGNRVLISHGVNIHDGSAHSLNAIERHDHFKHILQKGHPVDGIPGIKSAPIIIEDDVWISFGVTILKGVRIGKGSVIAAGATVTTDVPPGMIYKNKIIPELTPLT
jgi:acetyltransferase-like isoleucine patch superfamily enzyme